MTDQSKKKKKKRRTKLAPYIYDARHHAHPYILSTVDYERVQAGKFHDNIRIIENLHVTLQMQLWKFIIAFSVFYSLNVRIILNFTFFGETVFLYSLCLNTLLNS